VNRGTVIAALAVVTAQLLAVPDAGAEVGRLFFTPAERAALEQSRRQAQAAPTPAPEPPPQRPVVSAPPPAEVLPVVTVDGYVRRSGGEATVWVNGENSYDGGVATGRIDPRAARIHGQRIAITPGGTHPPVLLKPGQSYDPGSATTADVYEPPDPARDISPN